MKKFGTRFLALALVVITLVMAFPITASAASRCKHRKTKTSTYDTVYEVSSATEHIRIRYRKEVCKSCDKVLDRWTEEKERDHDFDNGVCEDCGYQRTITDLLKQENVIVWKNGSKTVYVEGDKTKWNYAPKNINGTTMVPITIAVEVLGGEYLYWDSSSSSAYIELDGEEVEYQKNNKRYWVNGRRKTANEKAQIVNGKLYVELKTLTKITSQDVDYKDGYVFISDNGVSSKEMKQIIDYLYNGKSDNSNLNDIKAGKVYTTSGDGKHIYKRTYDTSKSCKYTDVYVCTLFNIELSKSAVLTLDGSYLYENGKKAFADVDTLQQADKRISQLNRIIDGANNACGNDVITKSRRNSIRNNAKDVIEEYEDVAKGTKALSKVSEVKASYIAKVGNKNSTVEKIQQKLYELGYTSQLVTGYYGDITFNNIAYFQIVNGLTVTGWVDSTTYSKLFAVKETVVPEAVELQDLEWEEIEETKENNYLVSSLKQVAFGNFTDDVTLLGTGVQLGMAFFGVDFWADCRDITADIAALTNGTFDGWQFAFDVIALVPVVGAFKCTDEAALLYKSGDKIYMATKSIEKTVLMIKNGEKTILTTKLFDKATPLAKQLDELKALFKNGKLSLNDICSNPKLFSGKTVDDYAKMLKDAGYDVTVQVSNKSSSGAQIIQIKNAGSGKNITQFQVSPGGGRHGELPYVKISTSDQGKIKIIDGTRNQYKSNGPETATLIFLGGE